MYVMLYRVGVFLWRLLGLMCILPVISKVSPNMTSLNLSRSGITGKAARRLGETLSKNDGFLRSLQCIDLSENSLKGEDLSVRHIFDYLQCAVDTF